MDSRFRADRSQHDSESSEQGTLEVHDAMVDSFASRLLESPVSTLQDLTVSDVNSLVYIAYGADHLRIHQSWTPYALPGATVSYCYEFPDSPTSRLLAVFSDAASTLGFTLSFTHYLTKRYRNNVLKTGSINLGIRDIQLAKKHQELFNKVMTALKRLPKYIFVRVRMRGTEVIAEYTGVDWHMYRNGIEILVNSPMLHYAEYNEHDNPLDFMQHNKESL